MKISISEYIQTKVYYLICMGFLKHTIVFFITCFAGVDAKVLCIWRLSRVGEGAGEKFRSLGNHRLLWHGTATSNLLSILRHGLLVAPPDAPATGALFGEVGMVLEG